MKQAQEVAKEEAVCTVCNQIVVYPDWECGSQPGPHQLPYKQYYAVDGARHIQCIKDRRKFALHLILRPAGESWVNGQQILSSPAVAAQFHDGKFGTTSAELQYYLDKNSEVVSGVEGERAWRSVYLSPEQRATVAQNELTALEARMRSMREGTSLLDSVKSSTK